MTAISLAPWKKDVIDRLGLGGDGIPGFGVDSVFREGVSDEREIPRFPDGTHKPYVAVWFGQRISGGRGHQSIAGVRHSAHQMNMLVMTCAPDGDMGDQAVDMVSALLLGFCPAGQGELKEDGAPSIRRPMDMSGVRARFAVPVAYSGTVDI